MTTFCVEQPLLHNRAADNSPKLMPRINITVLRHRRKAECARIKAHNTCQLRATADIATLCVLNLWRRLHCCKQQCSRSSPNQAHLKRLSSVTWRARHSFPGALAAARASMETCASDEHHWWHTRDSSAKLEARALSAARVYSNATCE